MTNGDNIKPCPFCGAPAEWVYDDYNGDNMGVGRVECTNRECWIGFFDDKDTALAMWNRRVADDD